MQFESKRLNYILITFASLALILFATYLYLVQYRKLDLETIIISFAESKMDGDLVLTKLRYSFAGSRITLSAEHISILDKQGKLFLEADKPVAMLRWRSLLSLNPLKQYHLLGSAYTKLYLARDKNGRWNYQKIFRSSGKQKPIYVETASLPKVDIDIIDDLYPDHEIRYSNMRINWRKQGIKHVYDIDIDSGDTSLSNHARLQGSIATGSMDHILRQHFDLDFDLEKINLEDFAPVLHIAGFDPEQIALLSRLGKISLQGKWGYFGAKLLSLDAYLAVEQQNLPFRAEIKGDFNTTRGETLMNWQVDAPGFNLAAWLEAYARAFAAHPIKGAEQYPRAASLIASRFRIVHPQEFTSLKLLARGTVNKPEFKIEIPLLDNKGNSTYYPSTGELKKIIGNFSVRDAKTLVNKLVIPLNYASLLISGYFSHDLAFDLELKSDGITLKQLKALILDLPYAMVYQDMIRSLELSGFGILDLHVSRPKADKPIKVVGAAQLAKVHIFHPDFPLNINNVFATINLKADQWELTKLSGDLAGDYFEAAGTLGLDEDPRKAKIALKLAIPKLDLAKVVQSHILSLFALEKRIQSASGVVSDLILEIRDVPPQTGSMKRFYRLLGNFDLNNISLNEFNKVNGKLSFTQDGLKINNLVFALADGSCILNGMLKQISDNGQPLWQPDINFTAVNLELSKAKSIIDSFIQVRPDSDSKLLRFAQFEVYDGVINAALHIDRLGAVGKLSFDKLNFQYDPLATPFREARGSVVIGSDRTVNISSLTGFYGSSEFKFNGRIKNLFAENPANRIPDYQLNVNGNFLMPEILPLLPKVVKRYCVFKGRMPVTLRASGNKAKTIIDVEGELSALDKFSYFGWLEIDPSYKVLAKSKFLITPQLIVSEDSQILFSKPGAPEQASLKAYFNIKDYNEPNAINYYAKFETLNPEPYLGFIGPHILTLKPFNVRYGTGNFICQTHGSAITQQTNCEFRFEDATFAKFGIGDLNAKGVDVKLLAVGVLPMETKIRAASGDWNTVPFTKLSLELTSNANSLIAHNVKANIAEGAVQTDFTLYYADLSSDFSIRGQGLPAHDVAQGIWALGAEVPEGLVDISFTGKTKGIEQVDMFFNLVGTADIMVKNGKLSTLKSMQRLLSAINGVMSFDLNNVAQSLINFQGGVFDYVISSLDYNKGVMSTKRLLLKAPQTEMILKGKADYNNDYIEIDGVGLIPKHEKSLLDKIGIGPISIGNALSLFKSGDKSKRYFTFQMSGPISNQELTNKSIQDTFTWVEEVPQASL